MSQISIKAMFGGIRGQPPDNTLLLGFPNECSINFHATRISGAIARNHIHLQHQLSTHQEFLAPLPGRKITSARGVSHSQSCYFVIVFSFLFYFILFAAFYIKNPKKIVYFYSYYFCCLLLALSCFLLMFDSLE